MTEPSTKTKETTLDTNKSTVDETSESITHQGSYPAPKDLYWSSLTPRIDQSCLLYSSMKLPTGCLFEQDGCDETELLARARRCQEIMKLSEQAKEAEAARVKAANIKPLTWAKPTFDLDSTKADTTDATIAEEAQSEEPQAGSLGEEHHQLPYQPGGRFFTYPRQRPTPEEVQMLVEFTNKWIPSSSVQVKEEMSGEETMSGDTP